MRKIEIFTSLFFIGNACIGLYCSYKLYEEHFRWWLIPVAMLHIIFIGMYLKNLLKSRL